MLAEAGEHLTEKGLLIVEVGNSQVHVEALYPEVDFAWLEFERGGNAYAPALKARADAIAR